MYNNNYRQPGAVLNACFTAKALSRKGDSRVCAAVVKHSLRLSAFAVKTKFT